MVADEVKQLAQETARATEDISARVETIQADAIQAGESIQSVAAVINRINEYQATIASAVEEQSATTQAINSGVNEAANGSTEIAGSIARPPRPPRPPPARCSRAPAVPSRSPRCGRS